MSFKIIFGFLKYSGKVFAFKGAAHGAVVGGVCYLVADVELMTSDETALAKALFLKAFAKILKKFSSETIPTGWTTTRRVWWSSAHCM